MNTTFHLHSWEQLLTTAYGQVLSVKILLVVGLLLTSAVHLRFLRPRLARVYRQYVEALAGGDLDEAASARASGLTDQPTVKPKGPLTHQVKLLEHRLARLISVLTNILCWEPLLGVGILICTGLLTLFAATLSPTVAQPGQARTGTSAPFTTTVKTSDQQFTVTLQVSPARFGTNTFSVSVLDSHGVADSNVGVSLYTTLLDRDIGTDTINLAPDGKGHFSAGGDLSLAGQWQIRIQIRSPDATLHETTVRLFAAT